MPPPPPPPLCPPPCVQTSRTVPAPTPDRRNLLADIEKFKGAKLKKTKDLMKDCSGPFIDSAGASTRRSSAPAMKPLPVSLPSGRGKSIAPSVPPKIASRNDSSWQHQSDRLQETSVPPKIASRNGSSWQQQSDRLQETPITLPSQTLMSTGHAVNQLRNRSSGDSTLRTSQVCADLVKHWENRNCASSAPETIASKVTNETKQWRNSGLGGSTGNVKQEGSNGLQPSHNSASQVKHWRNGRSDSSAQQTAVSSTSANGLSECPSAGSRSNASSKSTRSSPPHLKKPPKPGSFTGEIKVFSQSTAYPKYPVGQRRYSANDTVQPPLPMPPSSGRLALPAPPSPLPQCREDPSIVRSSVNLCEKPATVQSTKPKPLSARPSTQPPAVPSQIPRSFSSSAVATQSQPPSTRKLAHSVSVVALTPPVPPPRVMSPPHLPPPRLPAGAPGRSLVACQTNGFSGERELEARFQFHSVNNLPQPDHFQPSHKVYPSQQQQETGYR